MADKLFDLLRKDHRQVEQMMDRIVSSDQDQWETIFPNFRDVLSLHLEMEEKYFYPRLIPAQEMKDLVEDALNEHQEAKDFLRQLQQMGTGAGDWVETFEEMQAGIQHHVEDEEEKIFPGCRKVLSVQQLEEIYEQCSQEKEKRQQRRPAREAQQIKKQPRI